MLRNGRAVARMAVSHCIAPTSFCKRNRVMGERRRKYESRNGVERTMIFDPDEPNEFVVQTSQDLEPVLDGIARDREIMLNNGHNKLVARLPTFVVEELIHRGIYFDEPAFKRWLNGPEATPWRIWQGQV